MKIVVAGGSGFVGRELVKQLHAAGHQVSIWGRHPRGQIQAVDYQDEAQLCTKLQGQDALINLIGILHQRGRANFEQVHHQLPQRLAQAAAKASLSVMLHTSALAVDMQAPSHYLRSKAAGEQAVLAAAGQDMRVVILRPSIIVGDEDNFVNQFSRLLKWLPLMPIPAAQALFQPVAVEDVAAAFVWALTEGKAGAVYELAGEQILSMREVIERVARQKAYRRLLFNQPDVLTRAQAKLLGWLPFWPMTYDNYLSLQVANIASGRGEQLVWPHMGIKPKAVLV